MYALGYSINVLTLLGLVLAIGLVVDDAIVVLENVHRRIGERRAAAARGDQRHARDRLRRDRDDGDARSRCSCRSRSCRATSAACSASSASRSPPPCVLGAGRAVADADDVARSCCARARAHAASRTRVDNSFRAARERYYDRTLRADCCAPRGVLAVVGIAVVRRRRATFLRLPRELRADRGPRPVQSASRRPRARARLHGRLRAQLEDILGKEIEKRRHRTHAIRVPRARRRRTA